MTLVVEGPVRKVVVSFCQSGADWVQVETSVVPVPLAPRWT
ncbi:cystathionine beta-lyase family protein involved in aluminum resistance [Streptomyces albogriseolus]